MALKMADITRAKVGRGNVAMQKDNGPACLKTLRKHLAAGAEQAARGEFVQNVTTVDVLRRAKDRAKLRS
jgi:hypothetical protein